MPLTERELAILRDARRAVLATITARGAPRTVPITFVYSDGLLFTPLDEKPKSVADPHDLARVHDIRERPRVSVLVDRWSEDWSALGWLRIGGLARLIDPDGESAPEHASAVGLLRAKYEQYKTHDLESRPVIRVEITDVRSWFATP